MLVWRACGSEPRSSRALSLIPGSSASMVCEHRQNRECVCVCVCVCVRERERERERERWGERESNRRLNDV